MGTLGIASSVLTLSNWPRISKPNEAHRRVPGFQPLRAKFRSLPARTNNRACIHHATSHGQKRRENHQRLITELQSYCNIVTDLRHPSLFTNCEADQRLPESKFTKCWALLPGTLTRDVPVRICDAAALVPPGSMHAHQ